MAEVAAEQEVVAEVVAEQEVVAEVVAEEEVVAARPSPSGGTPGPGL